MYCIYYIFARFMSNNVFYHLKLKAKAYIKEVCRVGIFSGDTR